MIRVTHTYHTVTPDSKLRHRWAILLFNAYAAEALGDMESYYKLCETVRDEFNQWRINAEYECKKKSHKDWLLGGGDTYTVNYDPFHENEIFRSAFSTGSRESILQLLAQMRRNNWMDIYPG